MSAGAKQGGGGRVFECGSPGPPHERRGISENQLHSNRAQLPSWGGRHVGAAFFREHLLPSVTDVFDFARFSHDNVVAEDGHVVAVFNIALTGTDDIIKIVDHWTLPDRKTISPSAPYFQPHAVTTPLGINP